VEVFINIFGGPFSFHDNQEVGGMEKILPQVTWQTK